MSTSLKQCLAVLFSCSLIHSSIYAEGEVQQNTLEAYKDTVEKFIQDNAVRCVSASAATVLIGLLAHIILIWRTNKINAELSKTIKRHGDQISQIQEVQKLLQELTSKTATDCTDEKGLNIDVAFAYIIGNIRFLNTLFILLKIKDKSFISNFKEIISSLEGVCIPKELAFEELQKKIEKLEIEMERKEEKNAELMHMLHEYRHENTDLKKAKEIGIEFIMKYESVRHLYQNYITGSPYTSDIRDLHSSDIFKAFNHHEPSEQKPLFLTWKGDDEQ